MKRKVKKYAGEEGSLVKGTTNLRTRSDAEFDEDSKFGGYGRYMPKSGSLTRGIKSTASEDRPTTSGVEDYESGGKRAGVTSPFAGPKEYITDSSKEDAESDEPRRKITDYSTNKGTTTYLQKEDAPSTVGKITPKKKKAPKYEDTGAKIGNQSFMPSDKERRRQLEMSDKPLESVNPEMYFPPLRGLNALAKGLAGKKAVEEVGKRAGTELSTMVRSPKEILRQAEKDITPRSPRLGNEPLKLGMRKGGSVKKMASGGKTSSASSRGDGIAQRGKTKGRIC
jgi:hypothetical protein